MMILGYLFKGQLGTVEGGSLNFVLPIEKRFKGLGGKITYNATVEKILVENDAAVGVRLADGSTHRADIVISAADLHSTLFNMLDGRYISERFDNMFQRWKMFTPVIIASFGINGKIKQYPPTNAIFLKEPFNVGGKPVDMIAVRDFSYDSTLAPQGKTVIQAEFESSFDHWNGLHANQEKYDKEKELVAKEVLKKFENYYPGITGKVEMTDIATPYTFWRYTRNHRGAFEGWLMTKESLMYPVEKILPGLKNFYLAGQWVEPGGGVRTTPRAGAARQRQGGGPHRRGAQTSGRTPHLLLHRPGFRRAAHGCLGRIPAPCTRGAL
jgi:phytoene dehydrogenase-like protein